jgi:Calx-beta domain
MGLRTRGAAGIVALLAGLSLYAPVPGAASPPGPAKSWQVEKVVGGYRVTLHLPSPRRMGDALPLLAVDGKVVGPARESADRRSITVVTTNPAVARATEVRVVRSPGELAASSGRGPSLGQLRQTGSLLPVDPGVSGAFPVDTAEYNLGDEAVGLPGLGRRSELRGKVYKPRGATGRLPLVVFLHGRHSVCYGPVPTTPDAVAWPCPGDQKPVPSFRGYDAPATALASHGYLVVSISANAINGWDFDAFDAGARARAELVLAHLDLWRKWSTVGGDPFGTRYVGRVDLNHVGLMGHSRGGEGVVAAALLNAGRRHPYGIRAVLPLAPTDFARPTLPGVAMSVVLPYCDGDVYDLQGQHFYDDSEYAASTDRAPRSTVLVMGANHNFFNTEWTPGRSEAPSWDDWFGGENAAPCGAKYAGRLTAKEQEAVGRAYIAGFFRLYLGGETGLMPLLDGSDARAASAGRAVVRVTAQQPGADRLDVNRLDAALPAGSVHGGVTATVCDQGSGNNAPPTAPPPCVTVGPFSGQAPHWTPAWFAARTPMLKATKLRWNGISGVVRLRLADHDVRRYAALTFRAAVDPKFAGTPDLTVRVIDGRGKTADVPVSAVSDALKHLPGGAEGLPKTLLRTVRIPLTRLAGVHLRDIRAIELRTNRTATGSVLVSDVSFARPSLGRSAPSGLPRLAVNDVQVAEGNTGKRSAQFTVTLSRRSRLPVTAYIEKTIGGDTGVGDLARKLQFAPGQTSQAVSVPITPNDRDGEDQHFQLAISVPHDAVIGDGFGAGVVVDDDPTPTVTVGGAVAVEGARKIRFPIRLSHASDNFVSVDGKLRGGTATLGKDFRAQFDDGRGAPEVDVHGYVEFGRTQGWLEVVVLDDRVKEGTETFTVTITEVHHSILTGGRTVTGTIRNDD